MRTRPFIAALALVAVVGLNAVPAGAGAVIEVRGIDATAALSPGGHRLRVSGHIDCAAGEIYDLRLSVEEDGTTATGRTAGRCVEGVEYWVVQAVARGREALTPGAAGACGDVMAYARGQVAAEAHWCRSGGITIAE